MSKGSGLIKAQMTFAKITGGLAIAALIVTISVHGFLFMVTSRSVEEANAQSAVDSAKDTASNLGHFMDWLDLSLNAMAGDRKLADIIAQGDPNMISQEENRITRAVTGSWLVRLLPENIDIPDETRTPKMGFSDLHMVINSVNKKIPPAIFLSNSPNAHVAMALRLTNGGGVIHASWPVKILNGAFTVSGACGIALKQENIELIYQGGANCRDNNKAPDGEVTVKGGQWKIAYWVRTGISVNIEWFVVSLLVSISIISGLGIFMVRLQYAALSQDRKSLVKLADDLISGNSPGELVFKIREIGHIASDILRLTRGQRDANVRAVKSKPDNKPKTNHKPAKPLEKEVENQAGATNPNNQIIAVDVSPSIFRTSDIRGIIGETIDTDVFYAIGLAIGAEMDSRGESLIAIGHDGRHSSPAFCKSLGKGLVESGRTVIDIGLIPTPLMYFDTRTLNAQSGAIVTGGNNPANYNGLKIILGGDTVSDAEIHNLRMRIKERNFISGNGQISSYNLISEYIERVIGDTQLGHPLKIVMDCGNGSTSVVAPKLIRSLGCEVIGLFCEVDGGFPNHLPNTSNPENLQALVDKVMQSQADLGVAYDGDGGCFALVDSSGKIIWPDRQLMLFSADVLSREPGADIIFDVRCTRNLPNYIVKNGGRPVIGKSGYVSMEAKLKEIGAMLAGEMCGHFFFQERWYGFNDGIYASARMIEILSNASEKSAEVFANLPDSIHTLEMAIPVDEGENISILAKLIAFADFSDARITDIDGLRVDFIDGWGLVQAINEISSALIFRFEADNEKALAHIKEQFKELLRQVKPDIKLPF